MENTKPSLFRTIISMMISPGAVLKNAISNIPWFFSLPVSALAFCLFFLQTGLDLCKTGQKSFCFALISAAAGAAYGLIMIPLLAAILWCVLKLFKTDKGLKWAISSFCLSYSGALIYGILGIVFSVLVGWKTAISFGVTGVIWATGPLISSIREMSGGKNVLSIILATFMGVAVLFSWSFFGQI
ncbi:MAG: hypothetical protein KBA53_03700 [Thermoclostridium sp.]|nr:hypothetical protein [Thermoclostridium sp.]